MTIDEAYQHIKLKRPTQVYITGKTSTGKSTFARKLKQDFGYGVVELEAVLLNDIIYPQQLDEQSTFHTVLNDDNDSLVKQQFIETAHNAIEKSIRLHKDTVIEGAVANSRTLQKVLATTKDVYFLYFHPTDNDIYIRNLTSRFMTSSRTSLGGLPKTFWSTVDPNSFETFCETRQLSPDLVRTINEFAQNSQQKSTQRLAELEKLFATIHVVEIS